jgi:hypothetical protein
MSLIFEGLKRNDHLKKQSTKTALPSELPQDASDLPMAAASLLPETYSQTLTEPDLSCITVNYSPKNNAHRKNDHVQIFRSKEQNIANSNEPSPSQIPPPQKQDQSTEIHVSPSAERIEQLRKGLQRSQFVFEPQDSAKIGLLSAFKSKLTHGLIILESIFVAPYKLLKFLCGTPLKSINFCSNWTILLLTKLWENIRILSSIMINIFTKLIQLCYFIVLRLPILGLEITGSFFKRQWTFFRDCMAIGIDKLQAKARQGLVIIGNIFSSLLHCYRTVFNKALSIYLPNSWIRTATVFLLKSSAIAISCCFVVMMTKNAIRSSQLQSTGDSADNNIIALKSTKAPQRKLRHLFRDPLRVKQEKVRDALLTFHIDTIQRYGDGKGQIITDNKNFGIGALLCEHPKIRLEKIGKNSLYFSDKYNQWYKRSIGNMLE